MRFDSSWVLLTVSGATVSLALASAPLQAEGLTLRQRLSGTAGETEQTQYLTANAWVADTAQMRQLVDFTAKTVTFIDKGARTYFVRTFDEVHRQTEDAKKKFDDLPPETRESLGQLMGNGPATLKPTGKSETIAGYTAAEYAIEDAGPVKGSVWITAAVEPPLDAKQRQMIELAMGMPHSPARRVAAAIARVKGLPLRTVMRTEFGRHGVSSTIDVLAVERQPPPADVLEVPDGFSKVEAPGVQ